MKISLLAILAGVCFGGIAVIAAPSEKWVHVHNEAEVSATQIRLGKVATISTGSAKEDAALARLDLGEAPTEGKSLEWTAAEVSQKLHEYVGALKGVQIRLPESLKISRVAGNVTHTDLKAKIIDALRATVTEPNWEIQVSDLVAPEKINVPPGGLMQITPPQVRPQGVASFELIMVNAEGEKTRKWINARVSYVTRVAILTRQIEARTRITEADIRWEKKEISQLQDVPAGHGDLLTGVAKFTLTPGMMVTRSQLEREMALRYGEEVEVLAGDEIFAVTSKGIAQQNGFVGDTVKIKSSINNKILDGLVTARGVVHVRY